MRSTTTRLVAALLAAFALSLGAAPLTAAATVQHVADGCAGCGGGGGGGGGW